MRWYPMRGIWGKWYGRRVWRCRIRIRVTGRWISCSWRLEWYLANALASQGQIETARQHYEASLRSDPNSAEAHNNLVYMLMRQGKLDRAESEFRSALALRPDLGRPATV